MKYDAIIIGFGQAGNPLWECATYRKSWERPGMQ
jgi:hypothetical protein